MRVLVLGTGGKSHAITWMFAKSNRISGLFCAPGNSGTEEIAENLSDLNINDPQAVYRICKENKIDFVFIADECIMKQGLVDLLMEKEIPSFGPYKTAASIGTDRIFAKEFMRNNNIPTTEYHIFGDEQKYIDFINSADLPLIVKPQSVCSRTNILESNCREQLIKFGCKYIKDKQILVEKPEQGIEISLFALIDYNGYLLLPPSADYKKSQDNNQGTITKGLGAICPVPILNSDLMDIIKNRIITPTLEGLKKRDQLYKGVLFFSICLASKGPKLLDYHVRLGDPEAQATLPLIKSDFVNLMEAIINNCVADFPISISSKTAVAVVVAAEGYPESTTTGTMVAPIAEYPGNNILIFHGATKKENNNIITTGGRCFTVVGLDHDILEANKKSYIGVKQVNFSGAWYRTDIGNNFLTE